jgi:hypothetical protein
MIAGRANGLFLVEGFTMRRLRPALLAVMLLTASALCVRAQERATTIRLTGNVLVPDCIRLGINLGGDAYYSGAVLTKDRVRENFEGTSYRECHFGPLQDEHGATTWFEPRDPWREILIGKGRYTILSGPAKGTTGTITDITTKQVMNQGRMQDYAYFVFDKTVPANPEPNGGLLIEAIRLDEGDFRRFENHEYWTSHHNRIEIGDVPPGSFGVAALNLPGSEQPAHVRFATHYQRYGETNGTWHMKLWTKAKSGTPTLTVGIDRGYGDSQTLTPGPRWALQELTLTADKVPEPKDAGDDPHMLFVVEADGGDVLIDDVEAWLEGEENPTAFRDDVVSMLQTYRPGVVRYLQMGGNTLANTLQPPMRAHAFTSERWAETGPYADHNRTPYSLHQMYELCEYIGAEPWYSLPGTLSYQEMSDFMEYLGAPADTGYGKVRAELGHPQPWTEVFGHIHVEFGNEAWNNAGPYQCGGFNGRDYWQDLIRIGKESAYYTPKVLFHAAGQAAWAERNRGIMANAPNADRMGLAPYIIHNFSQAEAERLKTDNALFRWAYAWAIRRSFDADGAMAKNAGFARDAGIELSIYEVNHHITGGDGPLEPRNKIVTSIGGGLNVANNMLTMLKEHGLRTQCLFSLVQHGYRAGNVGIVRLWGTALNMREGHERYRPTFLACMLANRVMGGNLVETVHSGASPTFDATGVFSGNEVTTMNDLPSLWSYGFADGARRGLIVVNLSTTDAAPVAVEFGGGVRGPAGSWLLTAGEIAANNEFELAEPQVAVKEAEIGGLTSGAAFTVPPFSMFGLSWNVE